jgi:hypothetical protein
MSDEALNLEFAIRINETDAPLTQEQRNYISDVGEHAMALRRKLADLRMRVTELERAHAAATYIIEEARRGFTFSEHFTDLFMQELSGWDVARAALERTRG